MCFVAACSQPEHKQFSDAGTLRNPKYCFPNAPRRQRRPEPELGWMLADGQRMGLSQQRGKVVVLDLYATWCEPCRSSIPHLIDLHGRFQAKGLALVGLNVGGPDDRIKVAGFASEFRITYPLGFPDQAVNGLIVLGQ